MGPTGRQMEQAKERLEEKERKWAGVVLRKFPWVHLGLGMLLGSIGEFLVRIEKRRSGD